MDIILCISPFTSNMIMISKNVYLFFNFSQVSQVTKFHFSNITNHLDVTHTFETHCSYVKTKSNSKHIYIFYFNILMPILFNLTPAILILVINVTLCLLLIKKIKNYRNQERSHDDMRKFSIKSRHHGRYQKVSTSQMSHFFIIISLCLWLISTNIPYYVLILFDRSRSLEISIARHAYNTSHQAISSIFFNSNHCINIIIYLMFYKDFRQILFDVCCCCHLNKFKTIRTNLKETKRHLENIDGEDRKVFDTDENRV